MCKMNKKFQLSKPPNPLKSPYQIVISLLTLNYVLDDVVGGLAGLLAAGVVVVVSAVPPVAPTVDAAAAAAAATAAGRAGGAGLAPRVRKHVRSFSGAA